jgi:hypothetical protein
MVQGLGLALTLWLQASSLIEEETLSFGEKYQIANNK